MASSFSLQAQLIAYVLVAAAVPAGILIRHARLRPSRPPEWLLEGCRLALSTLLILAIVLFLMTFSDGELDLISLFPSGAGAFILTLCLRSLGRGTAQPYIRGFDNSYERDQQPIRYWLSLGWNTMLGFLLLLAAIGTTSTNRIFPDEDACFTSRDAALPAEVDAACTRLLAEADIDARTRGYAHHFRADAREKLGRYREGQVDRRAAISAYGEALSEDPGDSALYLNSGLAFSSIGAFRPAREAFDAAILLDPDNGEAFLNRGLVNLDDNRLPDAVQDFTRAAERKPGEAWPLVNRGIAHAMLGNVAAAEADFAQGRRLDSANNGLLRGQALLALRAGDEEGALAALTEAVQRDSGDRWSANLRNEILRGRDRAFDAAEMAGG